MPKIGIVFGLSHVASSYFYYNFCHRFRKITDGQPELIIYNVPLVLGNENAHLVGLNLNDYYQQILENALVFFKCSCVDYVVLPCFSLSPTFFKLCKEYNMKYINPFDEIITTGRIGIVSINNDKAIAELIKIRNIGIDVVSLDDSIIIEVRRVVQSIVSGVDENGFKSIINRIEYYFREKKVEQYCLCCSELCMFKTKGSMKVYNLLEILIDRMIKKLE